MHMSRVRIPYLDTEVGVGDGLEIERQGALEPSITSWHDIEKIVCDHGYIYLFLSEKLLMICSAKMKSITPTIFSQPKDTKSYIVNNASVVRRKK